MPNEPDQVAMARDDATRRCYMIVATTAPA
jgi:hypothetical protein